MQVSNAEGIAFGQVVEMEIIKCYKCGIPFAVPDTFKAMLKSTQETFFCPSGHQQVYTKSTETFLREKIENQKLESEKEKKRLQRIITSTQLEADAWKNHWEIQLKEKKKISAKLKSTEKRIANGVCTCCNRTFQDLAAHMKTKHPEIFKK